MRKKTAIILVSILGLIAGCKKECPNTITKTIVEKVNQQLIDSFINDIALKNKQLLSLQTALQQSKSREKETTEKYRKLYEKINNSNSSSVQFELTKKLLTAHSRYPIERN